MGGAAFVYLLCLTPAVGLAWRFVWRKRMAALYALLIFSTFAGALARPFGLPIPILLGIGVVLLELLIRATASRPQPWEKPTLFDGLALGLAAWGLLVTAVRSGSLEEVRQLLVIALILLAAKLRPRLGDEGWRELALACVLGGALVAVACVLQMRTGDPTLFGLLELAPKYLREEANRPTGLQGNPNAASMYLNFGLCGCLGLLGSKPRRLWRTGALISVALLIGWALLLCQSRSALGGGGMVVAMWCVWVLSRRPRLALVATGVFAGLLVVAQKSALRFGELILQEREGLDELGREERWSLGVDIILDNPLMGDPYAKFDYELANYHNDFLQMGAEFGLPAVALFLGLLASLFFCLWGAVEESPGGLAAMAAFLMLATVVHGMFHVQLRGGIAFWFLIGLAANYRNYRRRIAATSSATTTPAEAGAETRIRRGPDGGPQAASMASRIGSRF